MSNSLQNLLADHRVTASAPCRIDSGGTWDIKAMALPLQGIKPTTVNIALNLRTFVVLSPYKDGWVKISSQGFPRGEVFNKDQLPFDSAFGLFFAAISHFGFHGLEVLISSQSPVKSALGGSSTAMVALVKALSKVSFMLGGKKLSRKEILYLSYHLEDGISGGNCGLQDQAAAVFGGVNQWKWCYGNSIVRLRGLSAPSSLPKGSRPRGSRQAYPFKRNSLLDRKGQKELSRHLLVAYSGKSHISLHTNRKWIKDFLSGETRAGWIKVNEIVHHLAEAIKAQNWKRAAKLLKEEMALRRGLTPEALIPITVKLVGQAEHAGCGARFAGAGVGGSIWALGGIKDIQKLKKQWENTLAPIKGAKVLDCKVDSIGVK